ncbi:TetR/AcrR family transcriptional regulator [Planomonospora venezuelensis]|uniref:AcrR family transcriptional regulator n=1 Tax=Planomonospora venezuelensis TaxID=1999 RepID=A0A841D581_PLAVE|nr:TetR/AcrR family transcriptional regulator [Planomonospora venezuelensis]MBB5963587.1 AcrR family transcriptional regulator [Planomonospora venezuelensis]GIN01375.1 putative trancscriptional regulator,TetR [Planomonospora venezuelensis]
MARPSDTKTRIQAAARELFLAQGVRNTSLKQISDRLGITKPALYYHFASRDDLVRSILQPFMDELEAFVAGREPTDARRLLDDYFDLVWRHREVFMIILNDPATLAALDLVDRIWEWRRRLAALLLGPDPSAAARIRATVAFGGMSDCVVEHRALPFEEVKSVAVGAALAALAA